MLRVYIFKISIHQKLKLMHDLNSIPIKMCTYMCACVCGCVDSEKLFPKGIWKCKAILKNKSDLTYQ